MPNIHKDLIETFCIVNLFKIIYIVVIFNLIETFCIVNRDLIRDKLSLSLNLIETFCIVNKDNPKSKKQTQKFNRNILYCK